MSRTALGNTAANLTGIALPPSAILTDGVLWVPLSVVTRMQLAEKFKLPALGPSSHRAAVGASDDSVTLQALLVGPTRYFWKQTLELLAESSRLGGAIGRWGFTSGWASGLILATAMTVRTEMQVTNLTFTHSAQRRDTLEVAIGLKHVPRPGTPDVLIDLVAMAVMTAIEIPT